MSAEKMARREKMDPNSTKKEQSEMTQAGAPPGSGNPNGAGGPGAPGGQPPAPSGGAPLGAGSAGPSTGGHGGRPEGAPGAGQGMGAGPAPGGQNAAPGAMSQPMQAGGTSGQQMGVGAGLGGMPGVNVQQGNPMNGFDSTAAPINFSPYGDIIPPGDPRMNGLVQAYRYSGMPTTWVTGQKLNGNTPFGAQQQPPSQMASQLEGARLAKETYERNPNLNFMTVKDGQQMPSGMGMIGQPLEMNSPIVGNMPQMGPDQQGFNQLPPGMPDAEMAILGNGPPAGGMKPPAAGGMNLSSGQRA